MRYAAGSRVGIVTLVRGIALSGCLVLMTDTAVAAAPTKPSGTTASTPTQNWDRVLPSDQRFTVLAAFNNEAVRDNETGLVWEKSPSMTVQMWDSARGICAGKDVGGRKGWRLPSVVELSSLLDTTQTIPPLVPTGHPFTNVQSANYWSATLDALNPANAWSVPFSDGRVNRDEISAAQLAWCVRGTMNADKY